MYRLGLHLCIILLKMDNCDLERLSVKGVKLRPAFKPHVTLYTAAVPSHISEVTLDVLTSDSGASCLIVSMKTCYTCFLQV